MICKNCGTENSAESIFCSKCGGRLDTIVTEEAITPAETPVEPTAPVAPTIPVEPVVQPEPVVTPTETTEPVLQPKAVVQPVQPVVNEQPVYTSTPTNNSVVEEKNTILWGILGLFIPIVGIILFIVWLKSKPKASKSSLIGAIIGIVLGIVVTTILFATGILSIEKSNTNNNNNNNNNVQEVNNGGNGNQVKPETKKTYEKTQAVTTVDGSKWHVIDVKGDTVTLLLDELVVEETGYGKSAAPEDQIYENSTVKEYIDGTYMPELSAKIDAAGGDSSKIKGRVITAKEYLDSTGAKFDSDFVTTSRTVESYDRKEEVCKFLDIMSLTKSFWTATNVQELDTTSHFYGVIYVYRENSKYDYFCDKNMVPNFAVVDLATNNNYQLNATFVGIRPVIETPTSNIK